MSAFEIVGNKSPPDGKLGETRGQAMGYNPVEGLLKDYRYTILILQSVSRALENDNLTGKALLAANGSLRAILESWPEIEVLHKQLAAEIQGAKKNPAISDGVP